MLLHQYITFLSDYYNFIKHRNDNSGKTSNYQEFQLVPPNFEHKAINTTHSNSARYVFLTFESSLLIPSSSTAWGDFSFACMDSAIWRLSCHPIVSSYKTQIYITIRWYRSSQVSFQYCEWSVPVNTMLGSTKVKHFYTMHILQILLDSKTDLLLSHQIYQFKLPVTTRNKATSYASDLLESIKKTTTKDPNSLWEAYQKSCGFSFISYLFLF